MWDEWYACLIVDLNFSCCDGNFFFSAAIKYEVKGNSSEWLPNLSLTTHTKKTGQLSNCILLKAAMK